MIAWLLDNSLWLVGLGLMLASSGIDGAYMTLWMPPGATWLGYVLNTVSDVAGMVLMYWYGRLLQTRQNESGGKRKLKLSRVLLGAEVVAVAYSWLFSWRQLLIVLPSVEGEATRWVAPLAAGFIPLLLASAGYAQSLLAGRIEKKEETEEAEEVEEETQDTAVVALPAIEIAPLAPALPVPAFSARQLAQIKRVVAVHAASENATLRDLQDGELIGSETTASRARQRAITGGYLVKTAQGFAPNGKGPQEVAQ